MKQIIINKCKECFYKALWGYRVNQKVYDCYYDPEHPFTIKDISIIDPECKLEDYEEKEETIEKIERIIKEEVIDSKKELDKIRLEE